MKVEEAIKTLHKAGFKEEDLPTLVFVGCLTNGPNKQKVIKWLGKHLTDKRAFEEYWANLQKAGQKAGYFNKGKIVLDPDWEKNLVVEIALGSLCAAGLIERSFKEGE